MQNPFRYFNSSPEVIRSAVMLYVRYPLSLRQVEDILFERGIDICHETVRLSLPKTSSSDIRDGVHQSDILSKQMARLLVELTNSNNNNLIT